MFAVAHFTDSRRIHIGLNNVQYHGRMRAVTDGRTREPMPQVYLEANWHFEALEGSNLEGRRHMTGWWQRTSSTIPTTMPHPREPKSLTTSVMRHCDFGVEVMYPYLHIASASQVVQQSVRPYVGLDSVRSTGPKHAMPMASTLCSLKLRPDVAQGNMLAAYNWTHSPSVSAGVFVSTDLWATTFVGVSWAMVSTKEVPLRRS